jgi:hypothetical protein
MFFLSADRKNIKIIYVKKLHFLSADRKCNLFFYPFLLHFLSADRNSQILIFLEFLCADRTKRIESGVNRLANVGGDHQNKNNNKNKI